MYTEDRLAVARDEIVHLEAEIQRLRQVMREVYHAGASQPGNRTAAVVEPLWKALQTPLE